MRKWFISSLIALAGLAIFAGCSIPGIGGSKGDGSSSESVQQNEGFYTVKFELCTELQTNAVSEQEVEAGDVAVKPSVGVIGDNPDRMEVDGWYTDAEYTNEWNFTTDTVEENMTLYAKWVKKFAVVYYLGDDADVPMYTRYVKEGELIPYQPELTDGYESKGFFTTIRHDHEFDFSQPITKDVNVFIDRSEHIYFSGRMIADRFEMVAAPSGAGSTVGTIDYVEEGEDDGYAKINFGYSTAADPYAWLRNVTVDISQSQKLEVTFKNLGHAKSLRFYYLNWMADGTFTDGQGFNENNTFTYYYGEGETEMDENDEWITKVFDFSSILHNGVSNWGISSTMIQLRIQSGYVSTDEKDLSNEIWIKSIKGIPDDTYVSTEDSDFITNLRAHDDAVEVENVANAQESICGWIFPKDYSTAVANNSEIYEKTNGLLLYSAFRAEDSSVNFLLPQGQKISLDEKTTIKIRLTNYGYANKITLQYKNSDGFIKTKDIAIAPCGDEPESKEYVLNMFGEDRYEKNLASLGFIYDSIGIDNAVLIESVEFCDFKMMDIPGVNFNDKYAGDTAKEQFWTTVNEVTYDHNNGTLLDGGTVFTTGENAFIERDSYITNLGYETMTLKYKDVAGVTAVKVAFTINGIDQEYVFDVSKAVKEATLDEEGNSVLVIEAGDVKVNNNNWYEIFLPFTATGCIEKVKVSFVGAGQITIQELRFNMDKNSGLDLSDATYADMINIRDWDGGIISYDNSNSSAKVSAFTGSSVRYYFGSALKDNKLGEGNIDLSNKSKLIVVYNNPGDVDSLKVALGLTTITDELDEDGVTPKWKTDITQAYNETSGKEQVLSIKTGMDAYEWATAEINLSAYNVLCNGTDGQALTMVLFEQGIISSGNINIRAIIII